MTDILSNGQLNTVKLVLRGAGELIMERYNKDDMDTQIKSDKSPVTAADYDSSHYISHELKKHFIDFPVVSEEKALPEYSDRKYWTWHWQLDPLDGTKEFIKKNGEFAVNLALINKNKAMAGFIFAPAVDTLYYAIHGQGAWKEQAGKIDYIGNRQPYDAKVVRFAVSRSHITDKEYRLISEVEKQGFKTNTVPCGSSLKHGIIAEGKADVYPKFGNTYEWDTSASQVIIEECGGNLVTIDTWQPLVYNKENIRDPEFIMHGPMHKKQQEVIYTLSKKISAGEL
jgi:3'(2'), 5'-bisphosphate nucleotidase